MPAITTRTFLDASGSTAYRTGIGAGTSSGDPFTCAWTGLDIHDSPVAGNPLLIGGYAKAAAPSDVSADGDAVQAWFLRNGAQATVLTAAGALIGGDASNGLDVDVTRLPALVAGTAVIGKVGIDQTTPGTTNLVQVGGSLPAGTNTIGSVGTVAATSGGESSYSTLQTSGAVIAGEIKGSAGQVYSLEFFNDDTVPVYLRLYDMTGTPGTGDTANIKRRFKVPAGSGVVKSWASGLVFSTGIGIRVTKAVADNDATVLAANTVYGNVGYK